MPGRSSLHALGHFLGAHEHETEGSTSFNEGGDDLRAFTEREWAELNGRTVYEMCYHGGLVRD